MIKLSPEQQSKLAGIAQELNIELFYLFGSAARGDMHANSDIDIAYTAHKRLSAQALMMLQEKLQTILSINQHSVDLVNITSAPPLLRRLIIADGQLLYGDPAADDQFYRYTIKLYIDSAPLALSTERYVHEQLTV